MRPILRTARLQLVNLPALIAWPWGILTISFLVNLVIYIPLDASMRETFNTGGLAAIYVTSMLAWVQLATQVTPFAVGLSVSRRRLFQSSVLLMVAEALVYGAGLYALLRIEQATGGWGVDLSFFGMTFLLQDNQALQYLVYVVPFLVLAAIGWFCGLVHLRWGANGTLGLGAASIVVIGALVAVTTWGGHWSSVGTWVTNQSPAALLAGWPLLLAAALVLGARFVIRRAPS